MKANTRLVVLQYIFDLSSYAKSFLFLLLSEYFKISSVKDVSTLFGSNWNAEAIFNPRE